MSTARLREAGGHGGAATEPKSSTRVRGRRCLGLAKPTETKRKKHTYTLSFEINLQTNKNQQKKGKKNYSFEIAEPNTRRPTTEMKERE